MKQYWLFGYDCYYPSGAKQDFMLDFDSLAETQDYINNLEYSRDYYDILDMQERKWIRVSKNIIQ